MRNRLLAVAVAGISGAALVVACSGVEGDWGGDATTSGPCSPGATRACASTLGVNGDVLSCHEGVQTCDDGVWSDCEEGKVVSYPVSQLRPQSLSDQTSCAYNPCDPNCRHFVEEPDAAIATEQGDPIFVWTSGDLDDLPKGLVDKGLVTPCNSGYDCQFNHECVEPVTHPDCAHSKCEPGVGLEPDCEDAYAGKNAPSCVAMICEAMPNCCASGYSGECAHDPCEVGTPLKGGCESCIAAVCANQPECCGSAAAASTDPIAIEVEDYDGGDLSNSGSTWTLYTSTSASGGEAMHVPDGNKTRDTDYLTKAPSLEFDVSFAASGRWYVWVRGLAGGSSAGSSDSCHVGLDGNATSSGERISGFGTSWGWSGERMNGAGRAYLDVPSAGDHQVTLWMREDGFVADRIVLTQDSGYVPSGMGPAAEAPTGALLSAEAESPTGGDLDNGGNEWEERSDSGASGGSHMVVTPDNSTRRNSSSDYVANSPRLDFDFPFPSSGRWYVHLRLRADDDGSNSVHVGLNGDATTSADRIEVSADDQWHWAEGTMDGSAQPYIDVSSTGTHTVNVWMREAGIEFDRLILTRDEDYRPSGTGPSGGSSGLIGVWSDSCVAAYEAECGVDCSAGNWTQDCVDAVGSVCDARCGERPAATCVHDVCDQGAALDARCHPCVETVCASDPLCCIDEWDADCVSRANQYCDGGCPVEMMLRPPESGECSSRLPGDIDSTCSGIDLAVGVPCEGVLPICNHGTVEAPSGIRVIHFPANSQQYPKTEPNESHPQMKECETSAPIPPGHCTNVTDCEGLIGNREIMVNPAGSGVDECSRLDNWSLFSGSASAECEIPVCSESDTTAQFTDTTLYFIMDKSGSMGSNSKWTNSVRALKAFFASEEAAGIRVSFEFYPLSNYSSSYGDGCGDGSVGTCDPEPCSNPMVPAEFLTSATGSSDPQEVALSSALDALWPGGSTPTYPALEGTLATAIDDYSSSPNDFYAAILVTDGEPNGCEESTNEIAKLALDGWLNYGIRTYTIGMEGANISALDTIAKAGGTRQAFVVRSGENVERDLLSALLSITRSTARCEFDVQNGLYINPFEALLTYTPGDGSDPVELPLLDGEGDCGVGWYYDDPADPTSAALCPDTCDEIQNDTSAEVKMEIGCAEPYVETEFSETYAGECPAGSALQWGYFTFDSALEPGAEILFEARTSQTEEGLEDESFVEVHTATDAVPVCGLGGPLPLCPINLYNALGGSTETRRPYLELRASLSSNSTRTSRAVLNSWEITFTCLDNE